MAISGVNPKCYILALFVRDDGVRFLLGDDPFEFKDNQLHFQQNTMANDVVEVQGNDGYLLAGQVRRPGTQMFDGYVCNGTNSKEEVEAKRRSFLQFFRRSHFYKVIYVFPNGTAIQRKQGFLVDDPTVQELYQQYPEYHVALNFEDVNYYTYEEDDQGHEIYAKEAIVPLAGGGATGGLIWDNYGVVWEDPWSLPLSISGKQFQILNNAGAVAPIENTQLQGDIYQQTYSGKNLYQSIGATSNGITGTLLTDGTLQITGTATSNLSNFTANASISLPAGTYTFSLTKPAPFRILMRSNLGQNHWAIEAGQTSATQTVASGITELWVWGYNITSGNSYNLNIGFQLEAGSTATSFEPYVGGIPAPNPDYPQDVQVVTGEQTVQVTGKNLFDKDNVNQYMGYFDGNADNPSLVRGVTNRNRVIYIKCKPSTVYSISLTTRDGISSPQVGTTDSLPDTGLAVTKLGIFESDSLKLENLTTSATAQYIVIRFQTSSAIVQFDDISQAILAGLQIEQGSTATAYEPYQGKTYEINLGKNLFDKNNTTFYGGYFGGSPVSIRDVTSPPSSADRWFYIPCKPNTTYTVTKPVQTTTSLNRFRIGTVSTTPENLTPLSDYWNAGDGSTTTVHTITTGANAKYLCVFFAKGIDAADSDGQIQEVIDGLQIELGSTATPYAPYFTPIELCKIGNYQDYIYKSGDNWWLHKTLSSVTFNGTESWGQTTNPARYYRANIDGAITVGADAVSPIISDYFQATTPAKIYNGSVNFGISLDTNVSRVRIRNTNCADHTEFETWLNSNNVSVYYPLATPTDTKITDATLLGQLEALGDMRLFIGENNVIVSATGTNLPATLAFDYYSKFATIGAEWEEGGTKGATIVDVDAIDNTYPVWELTGPATNPTLSVLTTNTTLAYNGTITASQKLVIDMFNKTATLNGTSVIGNISGDFVYMAPGTNRLAYTAGNTDAPDSTIYWQEVVG